jgi:hypothetical protein
MNQRSHSDAFCWKSACSSSLTILGLICHKAANSAQPKVCAFRQVETFRSFSIFVVVETSVSKTQTFGCSQNVSGNAFLSICVFL